MRNRVYIVCGGTGGHLAPGIATAQRLMASKVDVQLIISEKEVDSRLIQSYPEIPFKRAKGRAFSWNPRRLIMFFMCSIHCTVSSWRLLRAEKPDALVAFGGFLSVSFVISARLLKIPVVLHEANRIPGKTIRLLSGFAEMVYLPEGVSIKGLLPRKTRYLGMPIRADVQHISKEKIRQQMQIPNQAKVLVVAGGSQGAQALNEWVERRYRLLAADGIWIILVSGPGKNSLPELQVLESDSGDAVELRTYTFHHALHELFSCADVVVSRAGAGSMAELVECLAPSILVPYPHAADGHQSANALYLERRGGAIHVQQDHIDSLYREVLDMVYNDWLLSRRRKNLRSLSRGDAAESLSSFLLGNFLDSGTEEPPSGELPAQEGELVHD